MTENTQSRKEGGLSCSYKECGNRFYQMEKGKRKFFCFPKDHEMCKVWLKACGREDLLNTDVTHFHKNRRLCFMHFHDNMYEGPNKTRLLTSAVPKQYVPLSTNSNLKQTATAGLSSSILEESHEEFSQEFDTQNTFEYIDSTKIIQEPQSPIPVLLPSQEPNTSGLSTQTDSTFKRKFSAEESSQDTYKANKKIRLVQNVETQTPSLLSRGSPRKRQMQSHIVKLRQENKKLQEEIVQLQNQKRDQDQTLDNFKILCDKFLSPQFSKFVKVQAELQNKQAKGRRYTDEFKKFALSLHFLSPKCYKRLRKLCILPSPRALEKFVEQVKFSPGFNENLFQFLKLKLMAMDEKDKVCSLCMDEISLKCNLFYNYGGDEVIGLQDDGVIKTTIPAASAFVIMVRGVRSKWKQAIGYIFTSTGCSATQLRDMLDKYVLELSNIGLHVVNLVSDMGANFIQLANLLQVTPENPKVTLGNQDLFYYFDPPHLIKAVRNMLLKNEFHWDGKKTSWNYIQKFYDCDKELVNRLAPKLTSSHIYPTNFEKMRVKYATQVLSATVAAGLSTYLHLNYLSKGAEGTIDIISKFDKLFDIFNSSKYNINKSFNKPFAGQTEYIEFLNEMLDFLNKVEVINPRGINITNYVKCINCWKITIISLILLWEHVKVNYNFSFIFTRRINQDCLENFFGTIRQQSGNAINPTTIQFSRAFRKLFLSDYIHSNTMNCEDDFDKVLLNFSNIESEHSNINITPVSTKSSFAVSNCDYHRKKLPEQNAFQYIVGYLLNKCMKIHSCPICDEFSEQNSKLDDSNIFIHFKAYNVQKSKFGTLKTTHEHFYNYIYCLENLFFQNIEKYICKRGVGNNIYNICRTVSFQHPCSNFPLDYLIKLFIRFRIFYVMKYTNRNFKTNPRKNRKLCILMNL